MLRNLLTSEYGHEDALVVFKYDEFNTLMSIMMDIMYAPEITRDDLIRLFWSFQENKKAMIEC